MATLQAINVHDKGGSDFKPTKEELETIAKKMEDPEFRKLWGEYMQSLSDPEYRKEEEEYLKQVEREAKEGGDYTFEFIFPKPEFVVELREHSRDSAKCAGVYLNICSCDKVDEPREETTGNRMASNWMVPVSIGKLRQEDAPEGASTAGGGRASAVRVDVYDAVYHPKALLLAARSDKFLCFLVEIAVENINHGYKEAFGFEFRRLSSSIKSVGTPANQTLRKQAAAGTSSEPREISVGPIKAKGSSSAAPAASAPSKPAATVREAASAPKPSKIPKFSVMHRGVVDMADAWNVRSSDRRIGVPRELAVRIELPEVARVSEVDVDVKTTYIEINSAEHGYVGAAITLPFSVEETPVEAKFDRSKRVLSLVLTVIPPPSPAGAAPAPVDEEREAQLRRADEEERREAEEERKQKKLADEKRRHEDRVAREAEAAAEAELERARHEQEENLRAKAEEDAKRRADEQKAAEAARLQQIQQEVKRQSQREGEAKDAAAQSEVTAATKREDDPEVIDLRERQREWLQQQQAKTTPPVIPAASPVILDDEDDLEKEAQAKRERAQRKALEAEKAAERLEAELKSKMARMPLTSRLIFAID